MTQSRWWRYIEPIIKGMTMRDAAHQAGFNQSALTRWKSGARADPEFVVKFARAFNLNVLEALVEAEFITEEEAGLREVSAGGIPLEKANSTQLSREVEKRLRIVDSLDELDAVTRAYLEGSKAADRAIDSIFGNKALSEHHDLIARINSGEIEVAAQEATDPLEENQP